jgi:hypothetical protein
MARYLKPDLLILDDMGMKHLPKRSGEYLFEIIMRRHELKSTLMTSNRPLEDWGKLIGDVPAATAILDRFLQAAEVVEMTGRSFRMKNGGRAHDAGNAADRKSRKKKRLRIQSPLRKKNLDPKVTQWWPISRQRRATCPALFLCVWYGCAGIQRNQAVNQNQPQAPTGSDADNELREHSILQSKDWLAAISRVAQNQRQTTY